MTKSKRPKVDTTPLAVGASNFRDTTLKQSGAQRLTIKPSFGMRTFGVVFVIIGAIPLMISIPRLIRDGHQTEYWVLLGFGLIFFVAGALILLLPKRVDFDLERGQLIVRRLWIPRRRPLSQVEAVQVIHGGWHTAKDRSRRQITYCSYQLNLVLDDPHVPRLNLSNHTDWDWTWNSGNSVAEFLNVPFLDSATGSA